MNLKYKSLITSTPFRISLGGGGTDLPFYSKLHGGDLLTASINHFITVSASQRLTDNDVLVQTTSVDYKRNVRDIEHDLIREALKYFKFKNKIQIATYSTIPSQTGLGSSSSLMVGIVNCLSNMRGYHLSKKEIAKISHKVEREILKLDGGYQDQYISSYGGIKRIKINTKSEVSVSNIYIRPSIVKRLEDGLIILFSGKKRSSDLIIRGIKKDKIKMFEIFHEIKEIGIESLKYLKNGNIDKLGQLMDRHWKIKKQLSDGISDSILDKKYRHLKKIGSPGGKIVGAGGGGFFMMCVPFDREKYIKKANKNGFNILEWKFDFEGTRVIHPKIS